MTPLQRSFKDVLTDAGIESTNAQAAEALNRFWPALTKRVEEDGRVIIRGFGSFFVQSKPARDGRNPSTGEKMKIPARTVFKFKSKVEL